MQSVCARVGNLTSRTDNGAGQFTVNEWAHEAVLKSMSPETQKNLSPAVNGAITLGCGIVAVSLIPPSHVARLTFRLGCCCCSDFPAWRYFTQPDQQRRRWTGQRDLQAHSPCEGSRFFGSFRRPGTKNLYDSRSCQRAICPLQVYQGRPVGSAGYRDPQRNDRLIRNKTYYRPFS